MISNKNSMQNLYDAFNRREIETVLAMITDDAKWANGIEGDYVDLRDNVREYWRQ